MKIKWLFAIMVLFLVYPIFSDTTNDSNSSNKIKFRDKTDYFMKFRGNVYLGFRYYPTIQDGLTSSPHISATNYTPVDYTDSGDPGNTNHTTSPGRIIGGGTGGIELGLTAKYSLIAPFMTTDNPLLKGNNLKLSSTFYFTPISMLWGMEVTLTPIAFLQFSAGFNIGSGWDFAGLFNGLGINDGTSNYGYVQSFLGPVFQGWFSATFQFDVAALTPKKIKRWTHIVMMATPKIMYEGVLNISDSTSYLFEHDYGQNMNGWNFFGEFILGYRIPVIEDDTGEDRSFVKLKHKRFDITVLMSLNIDSLRLTHYFDSQMDNAGWGSDFCFVYFGPGVKFDLPNNFYAIFLAEWRNDIEYTSQTVGNLFYQDRVYKDWYVYFSRITLAFGWSF